MGLLQNEGGRGIVLLGLLGGSGELVQAVQPDGNLHPLELVLQFQILSGLFGLHLQGLQLQLQLRYLVPNTQEIVLSLGELALGLFLAVAVFGNTGGLFEDFPAVVAFQGQDFIDTSLTDIGITLPAQAGVHKQLVDVFEPGGLLVDIVFSVPAAVIAAGDHHLVGIIGKRPVGIVQGQGCLGKADGTSLLGSAEDDILHLGTPEGFGALLAQNPQNSIGNI